MSSKSRIAGFAFFALLIAACGGGGGGGPTAPTYPARVNLDWDITRAVTTLSPAQSLTLKLGNETKVINRPTVEATTTIDFTAKAPAGATKFIVSHYSGANAQGTRLITGEVTLTGAKIDERMVFNAGSLEPADMIETVRPSTPGFVITSNSTGDALDLVGVTFQGATVPLSGLQFDGGSNFLVKSGKVIGLWDGVHNTQVKFAKTPYNYQLNMPLEARLTTDSGTTVAPNFVGQYFAGIGTLRRWGSYPLTVRIFENSELTPDARASIEAALIAWNTRSGNRVRFTMTNSSSAKITIRVDTAFINNYNQTTGGSAIGLCSTQSIGTQIQDAEIYGHGEFRATTAMWIHEIGHALGLPHSAIEPSVMWPSLGGVFNVKDVNTVRTGHGDSFGFFSPQAQGPITTEIIPCFETH